MSFWKTLFGGGKPADPATAKVVRQLEYKGYLIEAKPYPEAGQYQVAGTISKLVGDERKEQRFVRADRFNSVEDAAEFAIMKGQQIIDHSGGKV